MTRLIAALLLLAGVLTLSYAQDNDPPLGFGRAGFSLPFDTVERDGKVGWKVAGRGNVRVEELLGGLADATGSRVTYSQAAARRRTMTVPYVGPDSGVIVPNDELVEYVSDLLSAMELALVDVRRNRVRVVHLEEAPLYARLVTEAQLASAKDAEWVTRSIVLARSDAREIAGMIRSRGSSPVSVTHGKRALILSGPAVRLRMLARLIAEIDSAGNSDNLIRSYNLPGGVKAADAAILIRRLFPDETTRIRNAQGTYTMHTTKRSRVAASAGKGRLIVRASPADHELVKTALESLK